MKDGRLCSIGLVGRFGVDGDPSRSVEDRFDFLVLLDLLGRRRRSLARAEDPNSLFRRRRWISRIDMSRIELEDGERIIDLTILADR